MPRPDRPLSPDRDPLHGFAQRLRKLRESAGNPTYAAMARRTGRSRTALSEAAGGDQLPSWDTVVAFVSHCHGDPNEFRVDWEWLRELRTGVATRYTDLLLSNLPRRPASMFLGRTDLLKEVAYHLGEGTPPKVGVALYGMGGVGKTEVALQHAHANVANYAPLWWITADNRENVVSGLATLTRVLAQDWPSTASEVEAASWAIRWLRSNAGWLLVLDNVADPATIIDVLAVHTGGRVIVTSRRSLDWTALELHPLPVTLLPRAVSVELLASARPDERKQADALASDLGDLPLAICHASAYLTDRTHVSLAEYQRRLTELPTRILDTTTLSRPSDSSVTRSLWVSIKTLGEENSIAASLLDVVAYFAPERLPMYVLTPAARDEVALDDALARIASYCLVNRVGDNIAVHRLVQTAIRTGHRDTSSCRRAVDLLTAALPQGNPESDVEDWPRWSALVAHIESIAHHLRVERRFVDDAELAARAAQTIGSCALYFRGQGRYADALKLFEQAHDSLTRIRGPDHPEALMARAGLAGGLWSAGRLAEGVRMGESVAAAHRRIFGESHPVTLWSSNYVAVAYREVGRHKDAIMLVTRTLETRIRVLGVDHPDTLQSRNILAGCYRAVGRHADAVELHESTLRDRVRILGPDHPDTLQSRHNLAGGYTEMSRFREAIDLYTAALEARTHVLGPEHPDTLHTKHNLGRAYIRTGVIRCAVEIFQATYQIRLHLLGPQHPDTLTVERDLTEARQLAR